MYLYLGPLAQSGNTLLLNILYRVPRPGNAAGGLENPVRSRSLTVAVYVETVFMERSGHWGGPWEGGAQACGKVSTDT